MDNDIDMHIKSKYFLPLTECKNSTVQALILPPCLRKTLQLYSHCFTFYEKVLINDNFPPNLNTIKINGIQLHLIGLKTKFNHFIYKFCYLLLLKNNSLK